MVKVWVGKDVVMARGRLIVLVVVAKVYVVV